MQKCVQRNFKSKVKIEKCLFEKKKYIIENSENRISEQYLYDEMIY